MLTEWSGMVLMVTAISLWQRSGRRRKLLEALKDGEKTLAELTVASGFKGGKAYVWKLMQGLLRLGYVKRYGERNIVVYKITEKGLKFLEKQSIEEIVR